MAIRIYNQAAGKWSPQELLGYDGSNWQPYGWPDKSPTFQGSLFDPYIAQGTVFTRDVRGSAMPLATNSAASAAWMVDHMNAGMGYGPTSFNSSVFATVPIAMFVVDSTLPGTEWQVVDNAPGGSGADQTGVDLYCKGRIPLPLWAGSAGMGDHGLALYDMGTGIMREYFFMKPVPGSPGHWTAGTAGYSLAKPGLVDLATTNYGMQLRTGTSAVVGMHNPLAFIGIAEVIKGEIGHAVAFTCADMGKGPSWPARMSDGLSTDADAPHEGQWCRLPASVDPMYDPKTGLPYKPMTRLIIRAFQRYGGFASDKNLWVHAFNGENGQTWKHLYGADPWEAGGVIEQALGGRVDVRDFPWELTEWAPVDWGRPSPDWVMRPWQIRPWVSP